VLEYFSQLPACEVALEACGGAHYWHREISKLGHTVRLLATNKVKPYLDGNKNNAHDAAAICEASSGSGVISWFEDETMEQASGRATQARAEFERGGAHAERAGAGPAPRQRSGVRQWLSVTAERTFSSKVHASPSNTRL
jgi:transposase